MTSTLDGSQAKAKDFLKNKSQAVAERMMALQKARMPDALERTEGKQGQDINTKVREGTIKII